MCLAFAAKVIEIKGNKAIVDASGEMREAQVAVEKLECGDMVLVQQGLIVEKVSE